LDLYSTSLVNQIRTHCPDSKPTSISLSHCCILIGEAANILKSLGGPDQGSNHNLPQHSRRYANHYTNDVIGVICISKVLDIRIQSVSHLSVFSL
jgi:hypothetical protein